MIQTLLFQIRCAALQIAAHLFHIGQILLSELADAPALFGADDPMGRHLVNAERHQHPPRLGKQRATQQAKKERDIHRVARNTIQTRRVQPIALRPGEIDHSSSIQNNSHEIKDKARAEPSGISLDLVEQWQNKEEDRSKLINPIGSLFIAMHFRVMGSALESLPVQGAKQAIAQKKNRQDQKKCVQGSSPLAVLYKALIQQ